MAQELSAHELKEHRDCPLCGGNLVERYARVGDRLGKSAETYTLDECTSCGLGLINPAPTGDLSRYYPDRYLSQEGDASTTLVSRVERAYRYNQYAFDFDLLRRATGRSMSVATSYLDIGCGSGERVTYARERGCPRSVGIDRYPFGKQHSRQSVELITTEIDDFRPTETFHVVSMFHVLEHVENPRDVLTHIRREIIDQDGLLIVQVPNYGSLERRIFGRRWFGLDAPRHLFQFDASNLRTLMDLAGFDVVQTFSINAALHPVTLVPSLVPALDVQRIWVSERSTRAKLAAQALWALATVVAIPVAWAQNVMCNASMLTVVARPSPVA